MEENHRVLLGQLGHFAFDISLLEPSLHAWPPPHVEATQVGDIHQLAYAEEYGQPLGKYAEVSHHKDCQEALDAGEPDEFQTAWNLIHFHGTCFNFFQLLLIEAVKTVPSNMQHQNVFIPTFPIFCDQLQKFVELWHQSLAKMGTDQRQSAGPQAEKGQEEQNVGNASKTRFIQMPTSLRCECHKYP